MSEKLPRKIMICFKVFFPEVGLVQFVSTGTQIEHRMFTKKEDRSLLYNRIRTENNQRTNTDNTHTFSAVLYRRWR